MSVTYLVPFGTPSRAVTWIEPTASDNSGRTPTRTSSSRPGDTFNVGSTQVTYTFTDQAGNSAMCMFSIIIGKILKKSQQAISCFLYEYTFLLTCTSKKAFDGSFPIF